MVLYLYIYYTVMHLCLHIGGRKAVFTGNFKALCTKKKREKNRQETCGGRRKINGACDISKSH